MSLTSKPAFANKPFAAVGSGTAITAGTLGSDTNGVTVYTAPNTGAYTIGSRIDHLVINTDDTTAVNVFIYIYTGSVVIPLGIVNVAVNSGNISTAPNIDALSGVGVTLIGTKIDSGGKRYIDLPAGYLLKFAVLATMTAAKKIYVAATGSDYATA